MECNQIVPVNKTSGLDVVVPGNPKKYSYSYRELLNNRRKVTYEKQPPPLNQLALLVILVVMEEDVNQLSGCDYTPQTVLNQIMKGLSYKGAVDSSDRITRLKLNTIRSGRRCGPSVEQACEIYRPGNAQTSVDSVSWPSPNNDYDQIKYKSKFNSNHFEVNYPESLL